MDIGKRIAKLRYHLRMTQVELAEKLGVDQSTLSRWERGTEPKGLYLKMLQEQLTILEKAR